MRHAILGPGGIGGFIGTVLAQAGDDVLMIVRPGTAARYPREFTLESPLGNIAAPVRVAERLAEPVDILWITVKATELETSLKSVGADARIGAAVPLLNGVDHVARLRERFGDAVVPATISIESERVAPGKIAHRSPFARLNVWKPGKARIEHALAALERFGMHCVYEDDEATLLWSKLLFLAPIALTTAAHRAALGEIVADPQKWAELESCAREVFAVASAAGAGVPEAETVTSGIQRLPGQLRSSMQKDVSAGKPPELDAIAGPVLRGGERYNIAVPTTQALTDRIRAKVRPHENTP